MNADAAIVFCVPGANHVAVQQTLRRPLQFAHTSDFKRAPPEGKTMPETRFQTGLPAPIAGVMTFSEPQAIR